ELVAGWQPHFQVVRLRGSETHVPGAEQHGTVMQTQLLQNAFRVAHQRFMLLVAFLRMRELEQFHFLKLVLPEDPAGVFSRGAPFGAEAGSPRSDKNGKLLLLSVA